MPKGQIIKALSGYYYVQEDETKRVWQCRARGVFKKRKISPLVGDYVQFDPGQNEEGTVTEVHARKNELNRPPVANVDQALLVFSVNEPAFSAILLDKFLVHIEQARITPVICLTKVDLADHPEHQYPEIKAYQDLGYPFFMTSATTQNGIEHLTEYLSGKTTVFAGQSGVGKSSLLNAIDPQLELETREISNRLGRGKHTTRHVELIPLPKGGFVADTPGFSQLDFTGIEPETLTEYFIDFEPYRPQCKFRECLHQKEPKCAVKQAVEDGHIAQHRYQHYIQFLEKIQDEKYRRGF
ncbi:ribosome small subunit-dependent GTPase A [Caldalkalibacillus salinus]|uniref:ribosome small subunit-dependent GTPase A n=1 Tax=Caldalkalibacillus salinus TaxID=2803787 RepID=UPI001923608A|nr:ribosome small subunit-dependent GTPase A [Caldalkalibacillus salinus]